MKKYYWPVGLIVVLTISTAWVLLPSKSSDTTNYATGASVSIPDDVKAVLKKSCMACHSSDGKGMAKSVLDLSAWDNYKPSKQAKKAGDICNAVTKGFMPPKSYRESNPGSVLTDEQKEMICKWTATFDKK